jgi:hypothetical protein
MKTQFERYCELQNFNNWCLRNQGKCTLLGLGLALVVFSISHLFLMVLDWIWRFLQ